VVWFGEQLPQDVYAQAAQAIQTCDLLLIVGTSGVVQPAASLVDLASNQTTIIEINPEPAARRKASLLQVRGTATQILPLIRDELLRTTGV
jgi:NAD-dependent deacetylase